MTQALYDWLARYRLHLSFLLFLALVFEWQLNDGGRPRALLVTSRRHAKAWRALGRASTTGSLFRRYADALATDSRRTARSAGGGSRGTTRAGGGVRGRDRRARRMPPRSLLHLRRRGAPSVRATAVFRGVRAWPRARARRFLERPPLTPRQYDLGESKQ